MYRPKALSILTQTPAERAADMSVTEMHLAAYTKETEGFDTRVENNLIDCVDFTERQPC